MTLSNSRQQFLPYDTHADNIQYGRKGGIFISTCVCITIILFAVLISVLVGVIVYFITYFKLSQKPGAFWDETEPFGQTGAQSPDLRLPSFVVPSYYRLKIKADLDNSTFSGDVYITIRANKPVKEIILHSKNLTITNYTLREQIIEKVDTLHRRKREVNDTETNTNSTEVNNNTLEINNGVTETNNINQENITTSIPINITEAANTSTVSESSKIDTTEVVTVNPSTTNNIQTQVTHSNVRNINIESIREDSGDRLMLSLGSELRPDVDYILKLSFNGVISNSLMGFYKSSYTNNNNEVKQLAVTQFEPISARAAFPCFDEPAFKAKFEISIAHPQNLTVLSNMNVATQEVIPESPTWQWTHFERSVNMSTYLVAYIICDFKSIQTSYVSKDNVTKPIRVWTRPELIDKATYALNITPKLLSFYEDVFGVPYALDKLDLIAIPDFSSGAMENWGLITFRETALLFDEATAVPRDKQTVAIDVAHELAHQWFGNLVTMRWWTDLWLNEGFATYIEYVGVNHIAPEWNMLESFSRDKMELLRSDAIKSTVPVSRQVVDTSQISQKFDEISYNKGANLIRMLNHTVSERLFHEGLLIYLKDWKYSNAEENDLWAAMSRATDADPGLQGQSVMALMNSWTRQPGYPVVDVTRDYATGGVRFKQSLFTTAKQPYKKAEERLWQIPLSYSSLSPGRQWSAAPRLWLRDRELSTRLEVNATDPLYVNVDAIGYYRVNYDKQNWKLLAEALQAGQVKSPVTKAQLIDDAFNLAKTSRLNYSYALSLTTCVANGEDSKMVWDMLLNNMGFIRNQMKRTSEYRYFQDYMRKILSKQLQRLNYGLDPPKDDNAALLTENLLMWECYVESPRCLAWARDQFQRWAQNPNNHTIPSYLRPLVFNMALRHGGRAEFDLLYEAFQNATEPSLKALLINNLPSTNDESLITLLLERSLSEVPKQYAVGAWSVEPATGTRAAQRFLLQNFAAVHARFAAMDAFSLPAVLSGAFGFICDRDEQDKFKQFALEHKEELKPMSQTIQKLVDTATSRIEWAERHLPDIRRWFKDYATRSQTETSTPTLAENATHIPAEATPAVDTTPTTPPTLTNDTTL